MIKKILGLTLMVLISIASFGDDDEKKKRSKSSGDDVREIDLDSTDSDDIHKVKDHSDDTLVFEDWDDSDVDNSGGLLSSPVALDNLDGDEDSSEDILDPQATVSAKCESHTFECNISLYPNPVVNELHISVNVQPNEIRVVSLTGETHLQTAASDIVDVSGLEVGIYFVQLVYDNTIETKKFVKK